MKGGKVVCEAKPDGSVCSVWNNVRNIPILIIFSIYHNILHIIILHGFSNCYQGGFEEVSPFRG